ncbi:hypothetical protein CN600_00800 [Bacillus mycoides]|nr:hypothetical protein CN600_00800 [Bacillus mycoides]
MFGGFAPSCEAKSASTSGAPSPSHSERAASAFCSNPALAASSSCLRTFRIRRQKASSMRKNLSQSELNELPPLYKLPTFSTQSHCVFYFA